MDFKEILASLRTEADMTQDELANSIFVSRSLVSKWESGSRYPSKDCLARLAVLFKTTPNELVGGEKENDAYQKHNIWSTIYSSLCIVFAASLLIIYACFVAEHFRLHDVWTNIGALILTLAYTPAVLVMMLIEVITLKKKNGYKNLELYSLFSFLFVWVFSFVSYFCIFAA